MKSLALVNKCRYTVNRQHDLVKKKNTLRDGEKEAGPGDAMLRMKRALYVVYAIIFIFSPGGRFKFKYTYRVLGSILHNDIPN